MITDYKEGLWIRCGEANKRKMDLPLLILHFPSIEEAIYAILDEASADEIKD